MRTHHILVAAAAKYLDRGYDEFSAAKAACNDQDLPHHFINELLTDIRNGEHNFLPDPGTQMRLRFRRALLDNAMRGDQNDYATMRELFCVPYTFSIGERGLAHGLKAGRRLPMTYTSGLGEF